MIKRFKLNKVNWLKVYFITSILLIGVLVLFDIFDISKKYQFLKLLDLHNMNNYFSAFITGVITVFAMWSIDNQNKKRWMKEGYLKKNIEFEIQVCNKFYKISDDFLFIAKFINGCGFFEDIDDFEKFSFEEIIKERKKDIVEFYHFLTKNKNFLLQSFSSDIVNELFSFGRLSAGVSGYFYLEFPDIQIEKTQSENKRVIWVHIKTKPNPLEKHLREYLTELLDSKSVQMLSNDGIIQVIEEKINLLKMKLEKNYMDI